MFKTEAYRLQTWLAALQIMITLGAWLIGMIFAKMLGYTPSENSTFGPLIRHGAVALILLSPLWVILTIRRENDPTTNWSPRHTLISGILLGVLMIFLAIKATQARRSYRKVPLQSLTSLTQPLPHTHCPAHA